MDRSWGSLWDYPRSRGATQFAPPLAAWSRGLSPLARGNLRSDEHYHAREGTIPARAGQPCSLTTASAVSWDYPRSRGATGACAGAYGARTGLSPLARGNRIVDFGNGKHRGTIPARAGQPRARFCRAWRLRDYPRSRGATTLIRRRIGAYAGLSPLARGNLCAMTASASPLGTIPARAGQPHPARLSRHQAGDYPRSRGATLQKHGVIAS